MTTHKSLDGVRELLSQWNQAATQQAPYRLDVTITTDDLIAAVQHLVNAEWGYLSTITGLDHADTLEVLYHFCAGGDILTLRVALDRDHPVVPSLCGLIPSAVLQERELHEMFGIDVTDIPDDSRLLLPDDWPQAVYPLRKDAALPAESET